MCIYIIAIVIAIAIWKRADRDDSDPVGGRRSGLTVYTDHRTGLQYLQGGWFGGITPRLDKNGNHIGIDDVTK